MVPLFWWFLDSSIQGNARTCELSVTSMLPKMWVHGSDMVTSQLGFNWFCIQIVPDNACNSQSDHRKWKTLLERRLQSSCLHMRMFSVKSSWTIHASIIMKAARNMTRPCTFFLKINQIRKLLSAMDICSRHSYLYISRSPLAHLLWRHKPHHHHLLDVRANCKSKTLVHTW